LTAQAFASPAELTFSRRELFIWFAAILFATKLFQSVAQVSGLSLRDTHVIQAAGLGAFQLLAWFAVFRLFAWESSKDPATGLDFAVIGLLGVVNVAFGMINVMPAQRAVWIVATLAALYIYFSSAKASYSRAAATVLFALAVQALWGPVFFSLFDYDLLRGDAALVGTLLDVTRSGYSWHDNVVGTQGHSIAIYSGCSSFHNVSLAMLCWVALTKLNRPTFIATDFIFGAAVCLVMIAVNVARLYVAALSFGAYEYWHNGNGAHIFQVGVSVLILLISLWGSSLRDTRHA
jgi:hypothetical protein